MARDEERIARSQEQPIVGGLPEVPGILTALTLTPALGVHLRGLADELLVDDFAGATITRPQREMLATAVSAANDCFYCMDSHGAFASALLERTMRLTNCRWSTRSRSARPRASIRRCRCSFTSRGPSGASRAS